MKYLLTNTVTYRVDTVAEVEKLHEEMKKCKDYVLKSFSYKTKDIKEKGEWVGEYQIVTAKVLVNEEKTPADSGVDFSIKEEKGAF